MKTCVVCERPLRSGRKYCFAHRIVGKETSLENASILSKADRAFIYFEKAKIKKYLYVSCLVGILIFSFIAPPVGIIVGAFTAILAVKLTFDIVGLKARRKIEDHSPEYEEFVRNYAETYREEKEYRKSLVEKK